jgi:hypothetical protein
VTHKEEEWFKQKYHPDDSTQRKEELKVRISSPLLHFWCLVDIRSGTEVCEAGLQV